MLQLDNISLQLGAKPLFSGLKLTVPTRAKIGVVGSNGSGKSSLLKVLAGIIEPDSGRVVRPSGISIEYVAQSESFIQGESALSYVLRRIGKRLESHSAEVAAAVALTQAGFTDLEISVDQLSGGWRKRLALAAALAVEPEILLLDEPTNHLDVNGLTWLEELLEGSQFGWVVVSHDRYFLERTVNQIVELSRIYPTGMAEYSGSYLTFKERRAEYLEQEAKRTSSLANLAKRELEWAARSPKARTGKAAFRMKQAAKLASDLKIANARHDRHQSVTEFQSSSRETRELVQMIKTTFQYAGKTPSDKPLIDHLTYTIGNGSCLGLLGANGQGKSTLLKLIGGKLQPSAGKVKQAQDLKVVYFDQLREALSNSKTLGELIGDGAQHVFYNGKPLHIVGWGKRFGFEMDEHGKPISELSGGERARALLSVLVRQEADLLLLDEPTNDLDIPMLEALEQMILEFPGATILVSHDRFLLDEVCSDFLGFLPDGRLLQFASYEQWFMTCQEVNKELELRPKAALKPSSSARFSIEESDTPPQRSTNTKKLSYKLQLEYDQIAEKIELAERQLAEIEQRAADPHEHRDATNSKAISAQLTSAQAEVERLYRRWEELEEIAGGDTPQK